MVTTDVNQDTYTDVIITHDRATAIGVMLGDGQGGFGQGIADLYSIGSVAGDIQISDNLGQNTPSQLYFSGNTFRLSYRASINGAAPYINNAAAITPIYGIFKDVNNDGYADHLYNSASSEFAIEVGLNGISFGTPTLFYAPLYMTVKDVADANGDGFNDLLLSGFNEFAIAYGDGTGSFPTQSRVVPINGEAQMFLNINHDGYADILCEDIAYSYYVIINDQPQSFNNQVQTSLYTSGFAAVKTADINADNYSDILIADGSFDVYYGKGDGSFALSKSYNVEQDLPTQNLPQPDPSVGVKPESSNGCLLGVSPLGLLGFAFCLLLLFRGKGF